MVLELQVLWIIEIDVGLREAVRQQRPGRRPVSVGGKRELAGRHVSHRLAASRSVSTCDNEAMTVTRPLTPGDADTVAELLRVNRDFLAPWEPVRDDEYYTADGQRAVIEGALERPDSVHPPVILNEAGRLAGRITLSEIIRGPVQSCSLGYWVSAGDNGRGLATAAVGAGVAVAFPHLRVHRVQAGTLAHNVRSQRVLERNRVTRLRIAPGHPYICLRPPD